MYMGDDGSDDRIELLVDNNGNINDICCEGETAFMKLLKYSQQYKHIEKLIDSETYYNTRYHTGETILHVVCKLGLLHVADIIVNGIDFDGKISLMYLADYTNKNRNQLVDLLLANGADVNLQDIDGNTAIMLYGKNRNNDNIIKLHTHGANLELFNDNGNTALHIVCNSNLSITNVLL